MTSRDFVYWLQGYFEISKPSKLTKKELSVIQNHLNLVFKHEIDPSITTDLKIAQELQDVHDGKVNTIPPTDNFTLPNSSVLLRC